MIPTVGDQHAELGRALHETGDFPAARQQFEQALAIHTTAYGPEATRVGDQHHELGNVLADLGDLDGARTHLERALEISQATLDPNHPTMATIRDDLDHVMQQLAGEGAQRRLVACAIWTGVVRGR
jgi:tetratricopeptide (TPR) repeat protein